MILLAKKTAYVKLHDKALLALPGKWTKINRDLSCIVHLEDIFLKMAYRCLFVLLLCEILEL